VKTELNYCVTVRTKIVTKIVDEIEKMVKKIDT